jgi:hypothetical protein
MKELFDVDFVQLPVVFPRVLQLRKLSVTEMHQL